MNSNHYVVEFNVHLAIITFSSVFLFAVPQCQAAVSLVSPSHLH